MSIEHVTEHTVTEAPSCAPVSDSRRWLLNSAVLTGHGHYVYASATRADLVRYAAAGAISRIGYQQTADYIEAITGQPCPISRESIVMVPGDSAMIVRLRYRVDPATKGAPIALHPDDWELGLLTMLGSPTAMVVSPPKLHAPTEEEIARLGEISRWLIQRDGARDLSVSGWRLGKGESGTGGSNGYRGDWTRGIEVRIWLVRSGRLITGVRRWSRWQGEHDHYEAAVHETAESAYSWLTEDGDGVLGEEHKEAWEQACAAYGSLAELGTEVVL